MTDVAPAGWYESPGEQGQDRYWDGGSWTEQRRPAGEIEPAFTTQPEVVVAAQPGATSVTPVPIETAQPVTPSASVSALDDLASQSSGPTYNAVVEVRWKGGWLGLFARESQAKALGRTLAQLNANGLCAAAAATDRWSFFRRLGWAIVAGITLGFVVRHQNLILVTAPIP